jgi:hypothetical protein
MESDIVWFGWSVILNMSVRNVSVELVLRYLDGMLLSVVVENRGRAVGVGEGRSERARYPVMQWVRDPAVLAQCQYVLAW